MFLSFEYFFNKINFFIKDILNFIVGLPWQTVIFWLKILSVFISAILFMGIIWSIIGIFKTNYKKKVKTFLDFFSVIPKPVRAKKWDDIKRHLASPSSSDWKIAILEADSLLDDIMKRIGYKGAGLGEKLKNVEPSDLNALQDLWEAHKVRNRIAHEAANFKLSKEETEKTLELYEKALKELEYL
jgi:hypothetical protein